MGTVLKESGAAEAEPVVDAGSASKKRGSGIVIGLVRDETGLDIEQLLTDEGREVLEFDRRRIAELESQIKSIKDEVDRKKINLMEMRKKIDLYGLEDSKVTAGIILEKDGDKIIDLGQAKVSTLCVFRNRFVDEAKKWIPNLSYVSEIRVRNERSEHGRISVGRQYVFDDSPSIGNCLAWYLATDISNNSDQIIGFDSIGEQLMDYLSTATAEDMEDLDNYVFRKWSPEFRRIFSGNSLIGRYAGHNPLIKLLLAVGLKQRSRGFSDKGKIELVK